MERVGSMELSGRMKRQRKRLSGRGFSRCGEWRVRQPIILQGRLFTDEKRGWKDRSSTPERAMLRSDSSFLPLILSRLHTINLTQEHFIGWIDYWTFTHRRDNIAWSRKSTNWIYRLCQHFVKVLHPRTFFYLFIMGDTLSLSLSQQLWSLLDQGRGQEGDVWSWPTSAMTVDVSFILTYQWTKHPEQGLNLRAEDGASLFNAYLTDFGIFSLLLSHERVLLVRTNGCRGGHTSTAIEGCPRSKKAEEGGLIRLNHTLPFATQQQWPKNKKTKSEQKKTKNKIKQK